MKVRTNFIWQEILMINAFIEKQNELIAGFLENYEGHVETLEREQWHQCAVVDEGEIATDEIKYIGSLSEEEYDLKSTFTELMPSYLLASSLITVWSIFEREMERMYEHISATYFDGKALRRKPPSTSKIKHLVNSIEEFNLSVKNTVELKEAINKLDSQVRHVRNAWAHHGGIDAKGKLQGNISGIEKRYSQIVVKPSYLVKVIELLKIVSKEFNDAIYRLPSTAKK